MGRMCKRRHILPYFMLMQASCHACHAIVTLFSHQPVPLYIVNDYLCHQINCYTMKFYKLPLLALCLMVLCACIGSNKYSGRTPEDEQRLAHDILAQANKTSVDDNKERMMLFNKATFHFANIVVRNDANDTLRADALFTLRWIAAYITHDYDQALQYLNQYLELVGPEHESYPTCLAYKADDLWHFGAHDSAMHYARMALEAPHTTNDQIEYICHHILWNIYDTRNMPDSAQKHKDKHMKIRESRVFEPMTMEQLKSSLKSNNHCTRRNWQQHYNICHNRPCGDRLYRLGYDNTTSHQRQDFE